MIKKVLFSFVRQFLFWIIFFNFTRLLFLLFYFKLILVENIGLREILKTFPSALHLDIATTCYIMVFPFLILLIQSIYSPRWMNLVNKIYTGILIFAYSLTGIGEMGIYAEWKTKLTYKVLKYFAHPSEIYNSAETNIFFVLLLLLVFLFLAGVYAYLKFFYVEIVRERRNLIFTAVFLFFMPGLIFIGMRGGIQQIPINQSASYFSKNNILNQAAVNNFFNLYISVFENLANFNYDPFVFMDQEKAEKIVNKIYEVRADTTISILTTQRPNIVVLILESWSADLISSLGGEPGITPEFHKLEKGGILFTNLYASGARSEQGMASIFSGFPATPISSITVQPDKYVKLPSLPHLLENEGYATSFYFGGQLIYGNIKSYIFFNHFKKITEGSDFPDSLPRGKLGIHDQYTLGYQLAELNKETEPFFSALFTVSTHSPWDQPFAKPLKWGDNEREYINAAYYTDHCLGDYFREASKQKWFKNTLFIIVADHSHNSYRNWHPQSKEYHKIPLLFYGEVIKEAFRGKTWSKIGNQHDIPATLLSQMRLPHNQFKWSKNLFNPNTADFAFFASEDGSGWIRPNGYFSFDAGPNYYHFLQVEPTQKDSILREGKAYLQVLFKEYLDN